MRPQRPCPRADAAGSSGSLLSKNRIWLTRCETECCKNFTQLLAVGTSAATRTSHSLGVLARGHRRGGRVHLPYMPCAAHQSSLSPSGAVSTGLLHKPRLPEIDCCMHWSQLLASASAHRPQASHLSRVAGPHLQDSHSRDCGAQLRRLDFGLPGRLVSDRDTHFTSDFWTGPYWAILGSPHRHNTTSKVERVDGVISYVLRSFAGERPLARARATDRVCHQRLCGTPRIRLYALLLLTGASIPVATLPARRFQFGRLGRARAARAAAGSGSGGSSWEVQVLRHRRKAELDVHRLAVHFAAFLTLA